MRVARSRVDEPNQGPHRGPDLGLSPHEAGSPRPEYPFVQAGHKNVRSQRRDPGVFDADAVNPSTTRRTRLSGSRWAFNSEIASAIRRIGILRPQEECTQVVPTTRVFGPIAFRTRSTISFAEIES